MKNKIHIHLDPIGGISGDMFIAAMIDAEDKLKKIAIETAKLILKESKLDIKKIKQNHIHGTSLYVNVQNINKQHHRSLKDIVNLIKNCKVNKNTKKLSIKMFTQLAEAEAKIHGSNINEVRFHEVGAWDSIIDNVISARIIEYFEDKYDLSWSCSEIPMGKGVINSEHGVIPVPAPATSLLLKDLNIIDDGIIGERVTPTGALILSTLKPLPNISGAKNTVLNIKKQGIGIGKKKFDLIPNILRVLIFKESKTYSPNITKQVVSEVTFNIDDQTPEDLSLSLENLRTLEGVLDIIQRAYSGKKNRIIFEIKIICRVETVSNIISNIFNETSTLGVRNNIVGRYSLNREISKIDHYNIKNTLRPSGKITKKVESDDLKNYPYKKRITIKEQFEK